MTPMTDFLSIRDFTSTQVQRLLDVGVRLARTDGLLTATYCAALTERKTKYGLSRSNT